MDDAQISWIRVGACLDVSCAGDGISLVADPESSDRRELRFARASLDRCGPAVVSPVPAESLGLWLASWLGDTSTTASWRVVAADGSSFDVSAADGNCRLFCRGPVERSAASRFRHDAHSLLNAIGMNADLIGMLAGKDDELVKIGSAAARVRASGDALAGLISSRTQELESGGRLPVAAALGAAMRRAGIDGISIVNDEAAVASLLWCLATSRVLTEWIAWLRPDGPGSGGDRNPHGRGGGLVLSCNRSAVTLQAEGTRPAAANPVFRLPSEHPAAPELEATEPTGVFGGMGVGFGSWQTRGAAGVSIGIPAF
jgi:hypothetical protein